MGRMLGAFDNSGELDRPDLNKCPDCECFFAGDNCPLCGKECPEEMRAGNRKPPKKEKRRRSTGSTRVTFVEWYHSWWFIAIMCFFMPVVGIILLATSPYEKHKKIIFIIIACIYMLISTYGLGTIIGEIADIVDPPVNTQISREEYVSRCEEVSAEEVWRSPNTYRNKYVKITVEISSSFENIDSYSYFGGYDKYYVCRVEGTENYILLFDCIQSGVSNFKKGDIVTVYGEVEGMSDILYDYNYHEYSAPCVNVAYATLDEAK